jgi:hypothetical protein
MIADFSAAIVTHREQIIRAAQIPDVERRVAVLSHTLGISGPLPESVYFEEQDIQALKDLGISSLDLTRIFMSGGRVQVALRVAQSITDLVERFHAFDIISPDTNMTGDFEGAVEPEGRRKRERDQDEGPRFESSSDDMGQSTEGISLEAIAHGSPHTPEELFSFVMTKYPNETEREPVFFLFFQKLIENHALQIARRMILMMPKEKRDFALGKISDNLLNIGDFEEAVVATIAMNDERNRIQRIETILSRALGIQDKQKQFAALRTMVNTLGQYGHAAVAIFVVQKISLKMERKRAIQELTRIAQGFPVDKKREQALEIISQYVV